jgi:hypothetical protein
VERANVDAVLKEQKLQALFGPQGVGERVKLGQLLKADLLVLVRTAKEAKEPVLEVVVSETTGGLRLVRRAVPVTKSADDDVSALLAAVREGLKRSGEQVSEVVAVPPLVSNDFGYQFDHLKAAFARLLESVAVDRKGVVAVELEEARALARELALTAPGAKLARPLPLYLLGEYRNEGKGKERTITLKLRAERGNKPVGKPVELKLAPDEAPGALRSWAGTVLEGAGAPVAKPDPRVEARVLSARAREFERLGNWEEALALIEASLLLVPEQPELWVSALRNLTPWLQRSWSYAEPKLAEVTRVRPMYLRGLEHVGALTAHDDLRHYRAQNAATVVQVFLLTPNDLIYGPRVEPATKEIITELQQARRELLVQIIPRVAQWRLNRESVLIMMAVVGLSPAERYELVERLTLQLQELPNVQLRAIEYAEVTRPHVLANRKPIVQPDEDEAYRGFLARLAEAKNPDLRAAGLTLARRWEDELAKAVVPLTPAPKSGDGPVATIKPVELTHPNGRATPAVGFQGPLRAGPGTDVFWTSGTIGVMKEKGKFRPVWFSKEVGATISAVVYDGRYVWATAHYQNRWPVLVVIDPVAEKAWPVTAADGLPEGPEESLKRATFRYMEIAPVEPGKICAAGSFGRAWIALVTFDAARAKPAVKVFHEAREAQDRDNKDQAGSTKVDFLPDFMFTLRGPAGPGEKPVRRILLGRGAPIAGYGEVNPAVCARLLVIDPDRESVDVLREPVANLPRMFQSHRFGTTDDAIFFLSSDQTRSPRASVVRIGLPDLAPKVVVAVPGGHGQVLVHDGRFHIIREVLPKRVPGVTTIRDDQVAREWWTADLTGKNLRLVAKDLPNLRAVRFSSHYGFVSTYPPAIGKPLLLHSIELPPEKK